MASTILSALVPLKTNFVLSFSEPLGLRRLPEYFSQTLASLLVFHLIYVQIAPLLLTYLFPKHYLALSPSGRSDWDLRIVSLVQSTVITCFSLYLIISQHEARSERGWVDRIYGYNDLEGNLLSISVGYFAWHLAHSIVHRKRHGWVMVGHGVIAFGCFLAAYVSCDTPETSKQEDDLKSDHV